MISDWFDQNCFIVLGLVVLLALVAVVVTCFTMIVKLVVGLAIALLLLSPVLFLAAVVNGLIIQPIWVMVEATDWRKW